LGDDPYSPGEPRSAVYIVIWNSDRTVEYHREGPYRGDKRAEKLDQIRDEIARDGLTQALIKRRLGDQTPKEPPVG
jgi:hypothetical protein